jgi:hypothetical protein
MERFQLEAIRQLILKNSYRYCGIMPEQVYVICQKNTSCHCKQKRTIMKTVILLLLAAYCLPATAQNNLTANIIEGGKTLIDLIRVIKTPKTASAVNNTITATDSCSTKNLADITYKNSGARAVFISLYKRTGEVYCIQPLTLKIAAGSRESLYEIPAGIYKFKIEHAEGEVKLLYKEGEIKIQACDKILKEIKEE